MGWGVMNKDEDRQRSWRDEGKSSLSRVEPWIIKLWTWIVFQGKGKPSAWFYDQCFSKFTLDAVGKMHWEWIGVETSILPIQIVNVVTQFSYTSEAMSITHFAKTYLIEKTEKVRF